jgi:hypothetical protein
MERLYKSIYQDNNYSFGKKFINYMTITPFIIVYFFFMDIFFLVNSAIFTPLIKLVKFLTCGCVNLSCLSDAIDNSYS